MAPAGSMAGRLARLDGLGHAVRANLASRSEGMAMGSAEQSRSGSATALQLRPAEIPGQQRADGEIDYERLYAWRFRDVNQADRQAVWREIALHRTRGCESRAGY